LSAIKSPEFTCCRCKGDNFILNQTIVTPLVDNLNQQRTVKKLRKNAWNRSFIIGLTSKFKKVWSVAFMVGPTCS